MNKNFFKACCCILLFDSGIVETTYGQHSRTADASSFERKWITKGITEMTCFNRSGNKWIPFGSFRLDVSETKGRLYVVSMLTMRETDKKWIDTSISDIKSLAPVYRSSFTGNKKMILQFGKEVSGIHVDLSSNQQTLIKEKISGSFFESYTYPYLLAALPLSSGYTANLRVYDYKAGQTNNIRNALIEEVKSNVYKSEISGEHPVWQVTVREEGTKDKYEYYIDKKNRRLWKIEVFSNGQHVLMTDQENDYHVFTTKFDKEKTLAMISTGSSIIKGEAFARDNQNEGVLGGKAILNINKKQYAANGVAVLLIPYTDYFKEWIQLNEASRKKGRSVPLSPEATACIKVATVYDEKGSFEFVNLQPGEYLLYTEFGYVHTSNRTEVVGYTDTYINGMFQGSTANTTTYKVQGNAAAAIKKKVTITTNGQIVNVKLKKTL